MVANIKLLQYAVILELTEACVVLVPRCFILQVDGEPSPYCEFTSARIHGDGQPHGVSLSHNGEHDPPQEVLTMDGETGEQQLFKGRLFSAH